MIYIILIFVNIVSMILGKFQKTSSLVLALWLGWLIGNADIRTNVDYVVYYNSYVYHNQVFEQGYMALVQIYQNLGLSYDMFRLHMAVTAMLVLWLSIIRMTKFSSLAILLFSLSNFFVDAIQIRNLLMMVIAILGFSILQSNSKKMKILGLLTIYGSIFFHSTGIFYLAVAVIYVLPHKWLIRVSKSIMGLSFVLLLLLLFQSGKTLINKSLSLILSLVTQRSNAVDNFLNVYQNGATTNYLLKAILVVSVVCIASYIIRQLMASDRQLLDKVIFSIIPILLLTLPLLRISEDYNRVLRNIGLLYGILLLSTCIHYKLVGTRKISILVLSSLITLSLGWLSITSGYYKGVVPYIPYTIHIKDNNILE